MAGPLGSQAWPALDRLLIFRGQQIHHYAHVFLTVPPFAELFPWNSLWGFEIALAGLGIMAGARVVTRGDVSPERLRVRPLSVARSAVDGAIWRSFVATGLVLAVLVLLQAFHTGRSAAGPIFPVGFLQQWSTWRALLAVGATGATVLSASLATPLDVARSASPTDALRVGRQAAWFVWAVRQMLGITVAWLWAGAEFAAANGLVAVIATLVRVVIGVPSWAAQGYVEARIWLFARGRMPWRTLRFLADAHRRGVLRQMGAVYQFRHIRLQERLAARHPLMITRMTGWARRELLEPSLMIVTALFAEDESIAVDDENARQHGWEITLGPARLRSYRDPRFDRLAPLPSDDHGSITDEQVP
jgi:hypothetical protein